MTNMFGIEGCFPGMGNTALLDNHLNRDASDYISQNYYKLLRMAKQMLPGENDMAEDLLQDVALSIARSEMEGEGYDKDKAGTSVAEFIAGRMKGYSKNKKYHKDIRDRHRRYRSRENGKEYTTVATTVYVDPTLNPYDKDGGASGAEMAYYFAPYVDDTELIEMAASLKDNILTCLDFTDVIGFDILELFKNIDDFSTDFDQGMFKNLRAAVEYHTDLGDALREVLLLSRENREIFDTILQSLCRQVK